jgi:hypothetical protein
MDRYAIATNKTPPPDTRSPLEKELYERGVDIKRAISEQTLSTEAVSQLMGYNQTERDLYDRTFGRTGSTAVENIPLDHAQMAIILEQLQERIFSEEESVGQIEQPPEMDDTEEEDPPGGPIDQVETIDYNSIIPVRDSQTNREILTQMRHLIDEARGQEIIYGRTQGVTGPQPVPDVPDTPQKGKKPRNLKYKLIKKSAKKKKSKKKKSE